MSRTLETLTAEVKAIESAGGKAFAVTVDASNFDALRAAFKQTRSLLSEKDPEVLVYNAGAQYSSGSLLDFKAETAIDNLKIGSISALVAAQQLLPSMIAAQKGSILVSGATASIKAGPKSRLAFYKFSLRALTMSLAKEFTPKGIHIAHFILDGMIDTPRAKQWMKDKTEESFLSRDGIAESYWNIHSQPKNAWSFEMDLRTHIEEWT